MVYGSRLAQSQSNPIRKQVENLVFYLNFMEIHEFTVLVPYSELIKVSWLWLGNKSLTRSFACLLFILTYQLCLMLLLTPLCSHVAYMIDYTCVYYVLLVVASNSIASHSTANLMELNHQVSCGSDDWGGGFYNVFGMLIDFLHPVWKHFEGGTTWT